MANVMAPVEPTERLIRAVKEGRADEVQVLVESTPELAGARDISGVSVILLALYHGRIQIAEWLAGRRTDLDVFEAASMGNVDRVRTLLTETPALAADVSPDGFPALALASFFGRLPVVRLLLARGADVNAAGPPPSRYTALTGAVTARQTEVVGELLASGADPNYRYGPGLTPMHVAAVNGSVEIVRGLIDAGGRADARADDGKTPLDYAREKGHAEVVALLRGDGSRPEGRKLQA